MQLYSWQEQCLEEWKKNKYRGMAHVVTGAGKTILALYAVRLLEQDISGPVRVRIVVPTCALAAQWVRAMKRHLPDVEAGTEIPGLWGGGRKDSPDRKYMIYVVNSARYQLAGQILSDWRQGYRVLLIADECHHYAAAENRKIFDYLPYLKEHTEQFFSLGLSATAQDALLDKVLVPALGSEIYCYGFGQAVAERNVSGFCVCQICLSFTAEEREKYGEYTEKMWLLQRKLMREHPALREAGRAHFFALLGSIAGEEGEDSPAAIFLNLSYQRQQLNYMARARSSCAAALIARLSAREKVILFCERICQAEAVYQEMERLFPGQTARYHSGMGKAARINSLNRFRDGSSRLLVTCRALDEGMDVPDASVGIIISGTGAARQHIQRLGRILRRGRDKDLASMYYFYVGESAEDSAFLADSEDDFPVCSLSYYMEEQEFSHPVYESLAVHILEQAKENGADPECQRELRRCLMEGLVRTDWLLTEEQLAERKAAAYGRRERNYWSCMERMAEEGKLALRRR